MFNIPFQCKRSVSVNKPLPEVMRVVGDFGTWHHWSPWICMEKDCSLEIEGTSAEPGHRQEWDGQRIGAGNMEMIAKSNSAYHYDLMFLKPWKSKTTVEFSFEQTEGATTVTWVMNGSLPFFMFFMKKMMVAWVESDFDRGLSMLKDYMEEGSVQADTQVIGVQNKPGFYYLGIRKSTSIADMPDTMSEDFKSLVGLVEVSELPEPKAVLSLYHKYDLVNQKCEFTSVLAYEEAPEHSSSADLAAGKFPEHKAVQVVHTGPFKHLGNGWSTVMAEQRSQKLKMNKAVPWYELYLNDPDQVPESELKTEINIPIK